jgi:hypothetical protein
MIQNKKTIAQGTPDSLPGKPKVASSNLVCCSQDSQGKSRFLNRSKIQTGF